MTPLLLDACGAVTPVGLSAFGTCAALRAGVSRIADAIPMPPPDDPLKGARVKARRAMRTNPRDWLFNLAAKALRECTQGSTAQSIALLVCRPEPFRKHPGLEGLRGDEILATLRTKTKIPFDSRSQVIDSGAAGLIEALKVARDLLRGRLVDQCVVGGFDSLLTSEDVKRLRDFNRIHSDVNPQGVIPAEGAVFLAVSAAGRGSPFVPLATISGFGTGHEPNAVNGPKYALGQGMTTAALAALADAQVHERDVGFIVSNANGERYAGLETMLAHARAYRTRREGIPVTYPASSAGEIGVGSSALAILVAATSIARGYAPAARAVCELGSEGTLRGACVVEASPLKPAFVAPGRRRAR
jgi:3-oxoacyl-[acyl-carrier-protein] synthase-1